MADTGSVVSTTSNSDGRHSFSSPYTAHTLDQIPTPMLKMLVGLGPVIRHCVQLIQVVTWQSSRPQISVLAVLLWICCCCWTTTVLSLGVPTLVLIKLCRDWLQAKTTRLRREKLEQVRMAEREKNQARDDPSDDNDYYDDDEDDTRMRRQRKRQQEEDELVSRKIQPEGRVSLDDTLHDLAIINEYADGVRQWFAWWADRLDGSRPEVLASALSVFMYICPLWILFNWLLGPSGVFALLGTLFLIGSSPWFKVTLMAIRQSPFIMHVLAALWAYGVAVVLSLLSLVLPLQQPLPQKQSKFGRIKGWIMGLAEHARHKKSKALQAMQSENEDDNQASTCGTRSEMIFQFEVYENQRWWLGMDWTTNMMPTERAAWTDKQLVSIESKENFVLPPTNESVEIIQPTDKNGRSIKVTTRKTWGWADLDWWVDMTGELQGSVDRNGWEYGNNAWKQMSGKPGMQTFTRRRRWCRRARLVERRFEEEIHDPKSSTSDINGLRKRA